MADTEPALVHLRAGGVSVVVDVTAGVPPRIAHWGAELDDSDLDGLVVSSTRAKPESTAEPLVQTSLLSQESAGFLGHPAVTGSRRGLDWSPRFLLEEVVDEGAMVTLTSSDPMLELRIRTELSLSPSGLLRLSHRLTNLGTAPYAVEEVASSLPIPIRATEVMDFGGRWSFERQPQRRSLATGTWLRELRHGRTGFDAPLVFAAGTSGFGNRAGQIWALHFAWSGNSRIWAERTAEGDQSAGAAELLGPGGLAIAPGESYQTPTLYGSWSDSGLDTISRRFHQFLRDRPNHPMAPRPVTFNSWEALYFDHGFENVAALADVAARVGAERFVLDDGWFLGRRDDKAGLGDWSVDPDVWTEGLAPLVSHVTGLGMQFGLWFEPEMVNPDSDLFRAHPDWILKVPGRNDPILWRDQFVLDVARPEVFDYLVGRIDALLTELDVSYVKWDHNRDLIEAGGADGRHGVHATTLAVYRLLDELRERHPGVEIESCSSGGGRVDLGILERTDRVWGSDSNDALDRHAIQRWTSLLLPPELIGSHVGPTTAHTTGRTHTLSFRAAVALIGSFGIEWNIAAAGPEETRGLEEAIDLYKKFRSLIHSGELVHADMPDPSATLQGVVAQDGSEALFQFTQLTSAPYAAPSPTPIPGLDRDGVYRLERLELPGTKKHANRIAPPWWSADGIRVSGRSLETVGLALPGLRPEQAIFVHLLRVA